MKFLGRCLLLLSYVFVASVLFVNLRLYWPTPLAQETDVVPKRLAAMLANNRSMLDQNAAQKMQALFPEGYYFSYLFHGLTWIELATRDNSFAHQAIEEASWQHGTDWQYHGRVRLCSKALACPTRTPSNNGVSNPVVLAMPNTCCVDPYLPASHFDCETTLFSSQSVS